jgi:hypothetical protein
LFSIMNKRYGVNEHGSERVIVVQRQLNNVSIFNEMMMRSALY